MDSASAAFRKCQSCRGRPTRLTYERATTRAFKQTGGRVTRLLIIAILLSAGVIDSQPTCGAEFSSKLRIGYPSSAVSTLPFDIAKEKGFYTKAGLDVEYIQMRSALGPQA